jgi:transcriptional regulator with XRE-family HTH domain
MADLPLDAAALIRRCRTGSGLTQEQLAVRAGTTKSAVSRLEGGHLSPTLETIERLLLCMGYRFEGDAVPMSPRTEGAQLDAVADLTPEQRLHHALTSQSSLAAVLGAARDH